MWRTGVEIVGMVEPSNFTGSIQFLRTSDARGYRDMTSIYSYTGNDIPRLLNTDQDPQSGGSAGKVYNVDEPGVTGSGPPGTIYRVRINFVEWVEIDGKHASDDLLWFTRISIIKTSSGDRLAIDVSGDNMAGIGTTPLTWNLQ